MATLAFITLTWMRRKFYDYDEELFNYAVDEYCSMNHRQVVKPYINKGTQRQDVYSEQAIKTVSYVQENYYG